jgi:hypothetical protein
MTKAWLVCALVGVFACGDDSTTGTGSGASGGTGGETSAGGGGTSSAGGTANGGDGGTANGGASNGGAANGGASNGGASNGGAGGGLPFGATCTDNTDCASGNCHEFNQQMVTICTQACSQNMPCPPESGGCNMMGLCRPPMNN